MYNIISATVTVCVCVCVFVDGRVKADSLTMYDCYIGRFVEGG